MKNFIIVCISLLLMMFLCVTGHSVVLFEKSKEAQILDLPKEYQDLGRGCLKEVSFNCCMASVRAMVKASAILADGQNCPLGYRREILLCKGAYSWCEKVD